MSDGNCFQFTCTWEIVNFLSFNNNELLSQGFTVRYLSGSEWNLRLRKDNGYYLCNLERFYYCQSALQQVTIDFKLNIISYDGNLIHEMTFKNKLFKKQQSCGGRFVPSIQEIVSVIKNATVDTLTIQCIMTVQGPSVEQTRSGCTIQTIIEVDRFLINLEVKSHNFEYWSEKTSFTNTNTPQFKITLGIPREEVVINILSDICFNRLTVFRLTFLNPRGKVIGSKCEVHTFVSQTSWNFPSFITKDQLKGGCFGTSWYDLILKCEISVSTTNSPSSRINYVSSSSYISDVTSSKESGGKYSTQNLRSLLNDKTYSDVKLNVQGEEIAARKAILGSWSPVFASMFQHDMLETKTGVVDIADFGKDTVKRFLEYIYSEAVEGMNCDHAMELIVVAEKYQVWPLKNECSNYLVSNLSLENVCDVISVADLVNHEALKSFAMHFIKDNASEILTTSGWKNWFESNFKLASEILSFLSLELAASSNRLLKQ